jgi:DNA adenine methylase Dam
MNRVFKYSGNKLFIVPVINEFISKVLGNSWDKFYEPFCGSAAIFYNLDNWEDKICYLNDFDFNITLMHNCVKSHNYETYIKLVNGIKVCFGDIKTDKEAYYACRNYFNKTYFEKIKNKEFTPGGLMLIVLANSCLNSMLRFSSNGMNQSFGNRSFTIPEESWNDMKKRLENTIITNLSWEDVLPNKLEDSVVFLDPPYVDRPMTYNDKFNNFNNFINKLISLSGKNSLVFYTDIENNKSDTLLQFGFNKYVLRTMKSTSPNRKSGVEETGKEILYWKHFK